MKRYKCHKIVEAGEIKTLNRGFAELTDGERVSLGNDGDRILKMAMIDPVGPIDSAYDLRGGYLVRYEDGYLSWSPKAVFEAGYAEIKNEN